jgi:hypothetical protein
MKDQVAQAWELCKIEFQNGRVNSERTLQALFFGALRVSLPNLKVLCEPRLVSAQFGPFYPDVLVASESGILAIVEFKFVPYSNPVFERDLEKLGHCASSTSEFQIMCDPSTGTFLPCRHRVLPDCILAFGVIGHYSSAAIDPQTLVQYFKHVAPDHLLSFLPLVMAVGGGT